MKSLVSALKLGQTYLNTLRYKQRSAKQKSKDVFIPARLCLKQISPRRDLPKARLDERLIHYLWSEKYFSGRTCQTSDGQILKIIFPGFWNSSRGPDFKQAQIELAGSVREGNIEIHLYSSDWYRHQHQRDKEYNRIILHVALWDDARISFVETMNHEKIPQLILAPYLEPYLEDLDWFLDLPLAWSESVHKLNGVLEKSGCRSGKQFHKTPIRFGGAGQCYAFTYSVTNQARLNQFVLMAAEARFLNKLTKFNEQLTRLKREYHISRIPLVYDELIYQGIMEGLGYKNNRLAFKELADEITYQKLNNIIKTLINDQAFPVRNNWPIVIQAILFWYSGLIKRSINDTFSDSVTRSYLEELQKIGSYLMDKGYLTIPGRIIEWNFYDTRPVNYPQRRIAGISYLLARVILANGLLNEFLAIFEKTTDTAILHRLNEVWNSAPDDYWNQRSKLGIKSFRRAYALLGHDRISALVVNTILPVIMLYSGKEISQLSRRDIPNLQQEILTIYKKLPPLADNYVVSFMKQRFLGNNLKLIKRLIKNAFMQQGLFQIFNDFCARGYEGCQHCGLRHYMDAQTTVTENKNL